MFSTAFPPRLYGISILCFEPLCLKFVSWLKTAFMLLRKIWSYLTFSKQQNKEKGNVNLKMMHGINRISIFMFIVALIIIIIKFAF